MARIISTEKSPYYEKTVEIYAKHRVGQYAKYLQRNPVYVEYFSINQAQSRADTGTNSISELVGPKSPVRYNHVKEFPLYNFPELKPDTNYDETGGFNIEMDLSGIAILPGTIVPSPDDFFFVKQPGMRQGLLFKINNFEFNTIQSNDFYIIDAALEYVEGRGGFEKYEQLLAQVADRYTCIFENIGTQDKCIVLDTDYQDAQKLKVFIDDFMKSYIEAYYQEEVGAFAYLDMVHGHSQYFYDLYLTKFIKDTDLLFDDTGRRTIALSYDDLLPMNFEIQYRRTLWHAVASRTNREMNKYQYYRTGSIMKSGSPFKYSSQCENTESVRLELSNEPIEEYLSQRVGGVTPEYFPIPLTKGIIEEELKSKDYLDHIIYSWVLGQPFKIDANMIMREVNLNLSKHNFLYFPIIIYILQQQYLQYFKSNA